MRKHTNMIIFMIVAYLLTLSIVRASAFNSLELCKYNPELVQYSMLVKLGAGR